MADEQDMTITLCSSVSFYQHLAEVRDELVALGHRVLVPKMVDHMVADNDFRVRKDWFETGDYSAKTQLIKEHFQEIEKGDCILVVNDDKNGFIGYIGGNVLMEMTVAFYLRKPIYLLNPVDEKLPVKEEVFGIRPIFLGGDLGKIRY